MDCADSPINLENQVRNGFSRQDIANYELSYYVVSRLLHGSHKNIEHCDVDIIQSKIPFSFELYIKNPVLVFFKRQRQGGVQYIESSSMTWLVVA